MKPIKEILYFLYLHLWHLLIIIPGAIIITAIHETAHALAVKACGGTVIRFIILPNGSDWGEVQYLLPTGQVENDIIALAPYLLWLTLILLISLTSILIKQVPVWLGSFLLVWLFLIPFADILNAAVPFLMGESNDMRDAWGNPRDAHFIILFGFTAIIAFISYPVQKKLYNKRALTLPSYTLLAGLLYMSLFSYTTLMFW